jgi:hypothetical protein
MIAVLQLQDRRESVRRAAGFELVDASGIARFLSHRVW